VLTAAVQPAVVVAATVVVAYEVPLHLQCGEGNVSLLRCQSGMTTGDCPDRGGCNSLCGAGKADKSLLSGKPFLLQWQSASRV
jgi:hypothetical protein